MTKDTRYRYEHRIKDLQEEVYRLEGYRTLALDIYDATLELGDGQGLSRKYIFGKFRSRLK